MSKLVRAWWRANLVLLLLCYVASCATTGYGSHAALDVNQAAKQSARAVSILVSCDHPLSRGSGVIVGDREVLTAKHVIDTVCPGGKPATLVVTDWRGEDRVMLVQKSATGDVDDGGIDMALLELATDEATFVAPPVRMAQPVLFRTLCVATAVPQRSRSCDVVQSIDRDKGWARTTWLGDFGNSGSGVYDEHDRLIGVLVRIVVANWGGVGGSLVDVRLSEFFAQE
jgi:hypothetical protein